MKKFTLAALFMGLTLGAFAQNFNFGKNNAKFDPSKITVTPIDGPVNKVAGAQIGTPSYQEDQWGTFTATIPVTINQGNEKFTYLIAKEGQLTTAATNANTTETAVMNANANYYESQSNPIQMWFNSSQSITVNYLYGLDTLELSVMAVEGTDSNIVKTIIYTPNSSKNGTARVDITGTTSGATTTFNVNMNEHTTEYFFFVEEKSVIEQRQQQLQQQYSGQVVTLRDAAVALLGYYMYNAPTSNNQSQGWGESHFTFYSATDVNEVWSQYWDKNNQYPWTVGTVYCALGIGINGNHKLGQPTITEYTQGGQPFSGIENVKELEFMVYPNPAADYVNVAALSQINNVELYNLMGQLVYSENVNSMNVQIPVASLEKGTYFVKVATENGISTQKVIVK